MKEQQPNWECSSVTRNLPGTAEKEPRQSFMEELINQQQEPSVNPSRVHSCRDHPGTNYVSHGDAPPDSRDA